MTLVALVSISLVLFSFSIRITTSTQAQCLRDQRDALIQLKQGFKTTELHSWNASTDCCIWDGITCDEQTGMVTAVNLYHRFISGKLNPALFNLSSLQYLNLARNDFHNLILPQTGFERLGNLTHLDLSESGFVGQVPIGISALTNLIALNLSGIPPDIYIGDINTNSFYVHGRGLKMLLNNLTKLEVLRLDGVDISLNGSEWGNAVIQIGPTLEQLSMEGCGLRGNFPDEIFHLTNLTNFHLSDNEMLTGKLPDSIGNLQYLSRLRLYNCSFYGEVPSSITNLTRLKSFELGSNILTGTIPMSLFFHPVLKYLDLSGNQLSGYQPEFSNGSSVLEYIHLGYNNFQGQLPLSIFKSPQLIELTLTSNNFNGTLNLDVIKHNKNLWYLDLSNNKLSVIEGKNNNESFYASFPQIGFLGLASCNITKFPSFLRYQTYIMNLDLSINKIDGPIPSWLCSNIAMTNLNLSHNFFTKIEANANFTSLSTLEFLDVHSNRIYGLVPLVPQGIFFVDFSSNYFFSFSPYIVSSPAYLSLSNNSLAGEIPLSVCNFTLPEFFNPLLPQVLDLSYNNLTGTMPPCLLEDVESREVLNLKNNKLSGPLPQNISDGCKLTSLNMGGNRISGSLPQSLMKCANLEVLDLGNNQIVDRFPYWLGNLRTLRVLVLRSNQFYGTISNIDIKTKTNNTFFPTIKVFDLSSNCFRGILPKIAFQNFKAMLSNSDSSTFQFAGSDYYKNSITVISKGLEMEIENSLSIFSSLDLSQNGFWGEVPEEIGQLKSLDVLNLSHNALSGSITPEFANLQQLQSLDLSFNQLSGHIPQELTSLTFLSALNLSYNNLVGEIPKDHQFATFSNDSYLGNPGLCGTPLTMQCAATSSKLEFNAGLPLKSSTDTIGLSVSIGLGLGVGFASIIWATISWENGSKHFNFIIDRFYLRNFH